MTKAAVKQTARDAEQVTNGAADLIAVGQPYQALVTIKGTAPLLFHAWNCESIDEKAKAHKGSANKKTDDVESYVYRTASGELGIAGACLKGAIVAASKFRQDPRSPRKSMADLSKAVIQVLDVVAPFEPRTNKWDYLDKQLLVQVVYQRQRVVVQRAGITRTRPAMQEGWTCTFNLAVLSPEYISPDILHSLISQAGTLVGVCDFRPTYGRFSVTHFEVVDLS